MAKWRIVKETKGMFHWKATSPDSRGTIRTVSFAQAIKNISDLTKEERQPMAKTLADMTAEERAECVGMWADTTGQGLGVVVNATEPSDCWVLFPEGGGRVATCHNQRVTPRFDLPRAWTPDGEPVEMKKERGFCGTAGLETTLHKYSSGTIYVSEDTPHGEVYRWVGDWEQVE